MVPARANKQGIVAIFKYLDDITKVADQIRLRDDFKGSEVVTHTSYHELIDVAEKTFGPSPVRFFTLTGALTGIVTGFGMPLWMDYDFPLVVGGKTAGWPSVIAYVVFGFELMVLFGAIATILGMIVMGRLPDPYAQIYDERLTDDRFAVFVPGGKTDGEQAQYLKSMGAEEVFDTQAKRGEAL